MTVQAYKSSRMYETFSYLPIMTPEQVRRQIGYALSQGWNPAVEHTERDNAMSNFWYMWKLPLFGEQSVDVVLAEIEACHREFPDQMVRFLAYDNFVQSQGTAFVVYR